MDIDLYLDLLKELIMKVELDRDQKKLLRKIIRIQLDALKRILMEDVPDTDITMYCLEEGVNKADLLRLTRENLMVYKRIFYLPNRFLELPDDKLSMIKHWLNNADFEPEEEPVRRELWVKFLVFEQLNFNPN